MSELTDLIIQAAGGNLGVALMLVVLLVVDYIQVKWMIRWMQRVDDRLRRMEDPNFEEVATDGGQKIGPRNGGKTAIARFLERALGVDSWEGAYSDIHELHAAEWGLMIGLTLALVPVSPTLGGLVAMVTGVKTLRDVKKDGLPPFVRVNSAYAVVHGVIGYLIGHGVGVIVA